MDRPSSQPSTALLVTQKKPAASTPTPSAVGLSASAGGSSSNRAASTSPAPSNNGGAIAVATGALVAKEGAPWPSYNPWSGSITMWPMGQHQQQNRGPALLLQGGRPGPLQAFMAAPHTYGAPLMPPGFSPIDTASAAGRAWRSEEKLGLRVRTQRVVRQGRWGFVTSSYGRTAHSHCRKVKPHPPMGGLFPFSMVFDYNLSAPL
jgi:hypothetical protein